MESLRVEYIDDFYIKIVDWLSHLVGDKILTYENASQWLYWLNVKH